MSAGLFIVPQPAPNQYFARKSNGWNILRAVSFVFNILRY